MRGRGTSRSWDVVVVASGLTTLVVLTRFRDQQYLLPFVIALGCLGTFLGRSANTIIRFRPVVVVGGMCYTIYLYHALILGPFSRAIHHVSSLARPFWLQFLVYAILQGVLILAVCAVLFVCTEKPFMKRWRGLRVLKRAPASVSSPAT